ncbi:MAG: serine hydrolase [Thermoanaerobaculia bacterium]
MRRTHATLAVLLAFLPAAVPANAAESAPGSAAAAARSVDAILSKAYPSDGPGAAVLVRLKGETILRKGYGMAQMDFGIPVAPEQVFEIGSVTKQFTAAVVLRLAEEGRLSLSDSLTKFLPEMTFGGTTITIEELLSHTSGVPNYTDMPEWIPRWREDMSLDTLTGLFRNKPLDFPPGTLWNYSNSGFILLGAVIEKVTGKTYEDVVEKELFAPLGMTSTRYGHQEEIVHGRVAGYVRGAEGWTNAPYLSLTQPYAAGSLMSNVDDLALWSDALEAGKVVSAASRDRMFTPIVIASGEQKGVSTRYGLGNAITDVGGRLAHEHGGGIHGFVCDLLRVPGEDLLIVLLSNNTEQDSNAISHQIALAVLGGAVATKPRATPANPPVAPKMKERDLDALTGVYLVPESADQRRIVTREGATLRLQRTGGDRHDLVPLGVDLYQVGEHDTTIRFARDAKGKVDAVYVDGGIGPVFRSRRTLEPIPAEKQAVAVATDAYGALCGIFALAPGFDITVTNEGEHLFAQATGQPKFEIFPESPTRFFFKVVDAQIDFVLSDGRATALTLHQGGQNLPAPRKP